MAAQFKMKNKLLLIVVLTLAIILVLPHATDARKGVGIVWNTESEIVNEASTHCIEYGIYNPWDEDVQAYLSVYGELNEVIKNEFSDSYLIKAKTFHDMAVPVNFCFEVAQVYSKDCLYGDYICEQTCEEPEVTYEGKIKTMEKSEGLFGGSGSSTSLGVSVPLKLKVRCNAHSRDWSLVYISVIGVTLAALGIFLYKKKISRGKRKKRK